VFKIKFQDSTYDCNENESVLDCLLRNDCPVLYSCRSGICQTCIMKVVEGNPPEKSQVGLKDTQIEQKHFLACSAFPSEDLTVETFDSDASPHIDITLIDKQILTDRIVQLRFSLKDDFDYQPGQYINLFREDNFTRTYSLASVPSLHEYIEIHVEKLENGVMSQWLYDTIQIGDSMRMSSALGECYYTANDLNQNILLIATSTGFAPIYGILRQAIEKGHKGEIHVYHGAAKRNKIYLVDEMREFTNNYDNVFYTPALSREEIEGFAYGRVADLALAQQKDLKGWKMYLCGHPDMVNDTKRKAFLAGMSLNDIYADPFELAPKD